MLQTPVVTPNLNLVRFAERAVLLTKPTKLEKSGYLEQIEKLSVEVGLNNIAIEPLKRIAKSHRNQQESFEQLRSIVPGISNAHFEYQDKEKELSTHLGTNKDIVLALGGDGFFVQVARSLARLQVMDQNLKDVYLLGINSDPEHSMGYLLSGTVRDLEHSLTNLTSEKLKYREFGIIGCYINGKLIDVSISEINLGATEEGRASKYEINDMSFKSSGLLVATGVGSLWFSNSGGQTFPFEADHIRYLHRESKTNDLEVNTPITDLKVRFLRSSELTITIDGFNKHSFKTTGDLIKDFEYVTLETKLLPQKIKVLSLK